MRWDSIEKLIQAPFEILIEQHSCKIKYFLIQNNTHYTISEKQYERINYHVPLILDSERIIHQINDIRVQLYKSKERF